MLQEKVLRYSAIGLATMGLGLGIAAAHTAEIDTTGPDSRNTIDVSSTNRLDVDNRNDVDVKNDVDQDADSGNATVRRNTNAGDAETGDASNDSDVSTTVSLSNGNGGFGGLFNNGSWDASIGTTGPDSRNTIDISSSNRVDIDNRNNVDVRNYVDQDADSGNATVERNTNGGSATTGGASNSSTLSTSVEISN